MNIILEAINEQETNKTRDRQVYFAFINVYQMHSNKKQNKKNKKKRVFVPVHKNNAFP